MRICLIPRTEVYNRFKLYDVDLPGGNIALLYQQATRNSTEDRGKWRCLVCSCAMFLKPAHVPGISTKIWVPH